jgi:hypothetical protein
VYLIEHQVESHNCGSRDEQWIDLATGRARLLLYGCDGRLAVQRALRRSNCALEVESLDYKTHTRRGPMTVGEAPTCRAPPESAEETAASYRRLLRDRAWHVLGFARAGGKATVHLQRKVYFPHGHETTDLYLDAVTYLPVRQLWRSTHGRVWTETSYEWLPRTAATLGKIRRVLPAWALTAPHHP